MNPVHLLLVLASIVCFAFSAWQAGSPGWNRVVSAGLMLLAASLVW